MTKARLLLTHVEVLALRAASAGRDLVVAMTRDSVWLLLRPENDWALDFLDAMRADDALIDRAVATLTHPGGAA